MDEHCITLALHPEDVHLRFLTPTDVPELKNLCAEWFPIEYPSSWYEAITTNPKFYSLAVTHFSTIIGILVCDVKPWTNCNAEDRNLLNASQYHNPHMAYILSLGVVQDYRRNGIASILLSSLLTYLNTPDCYNCKAVYLHVLTTNSGAIQFYNQRNFKKHSYLPFYYSIRGAPSDGFCYVLYMNGGQAPWSFYECLRQIGSYVSKLQPCAMPQHAIATAHNLWQKLLDRFQTHIHTTHVS